MLISKRVVQLECEEVVVVKDYRGFFFIQCQRAALLKAFEKTSNGASSAPKLAMWIAAFTEAARCNVFLRTVCCVCLCVEVLFLLFFFHFHVCMHVCIMDCLCVSERFGGFYVNNPSRRQKKKKSQQQKCTAGRISGAFFLSWCLNPSQSSSRDNLSFIHVRKASDITNSSSVSLLPLPLSVLWYPSLILLFYLKILPTSLLITILSIILFWFEGFCLQNRFRSSILSAVFLFVCLIQEQLGKDLPHRLHSSCCKFLAYRGSKQAWSHHLGKSLAEGPRCSSESSAAALCLPQVVPHSTPGVTDLWFTTVVVPRLHFLHVLMTSLKHPEQV